MSHYWTMENLHATHFTQLYTFRNDLLSWLTSTYCDFQSRVGVFILRPGPNLVLQCHQTESRQRMAYYRCDNLDKKQKIILTRFYLLGKIQN